MTKEIELSSQQSTLEGDVTRKAPRIRSSAYPSYDIEFSVEFTKKFHQNFGNSNFIQREEIAKVLKISVGHIQTQLSAAVQYGTVDMKTKAGYKPSPSFLKIYKPISEDEKREALIDCLLKPELYKKLLIQFKNNTVPTIGALSTILFRNHNIAEAASENAAEIFIRNLKYLSLLDEENNLLLDREISDIDEDDYNIEVNGQKMEMKVSPVNGKSIVQAAVTPTAAAAIQHNKDSYPIPIPLKGDRVATLIIPKDIKNEDLDKITRFIEALRE